MGLYGNWAFNSPALPKPKNAEEQAARDASNALAIERIKTNPDALKQGSMGLFTGNHPSGTMQQMADTAPDSFHETVNNNVLSGSGQLIGAFARPVVDMVKGVGSALPTSSTEQIKQWIASKQPVQNYSHPPLNPDGSYSDVPSIPSNQTPIYSSPEERTVRELARQPAEHSDATVGATGGTAPKIVAPEQKATGAGISPAIPVPPQQNPELSPSQQPYGAFVQENPDATNRRISNQADVRSALKFGPQEAAMVRAAQEESNNNKKGLELINQGFTEVNNVQAAPGDYAGTPFYRKTTDISAEQLQKSDPARYKALMELQALREADAAAQAKQYQQTGQTPPPIVRKGSLNEPVTTIMQPNAPVAGRSLDPNAPKPFDMNNMEEYKVEIPGKGWMTGIRQKDPNRQQGTLSVTPGLSDAERQQVAQIDENQARQAAYGVSRKTGELYDAAQQHQQQQAALSALKQMQMQQEQGQFKATYDQKQAEIAQQGKQHADTMDWRAAELSQKELASKRGAVKPLAPLPNALDYLKVFDANPLTMQLPQEQKEDLALKGLGVVDDETKPIFRSKAKPGKVFIRNPDKSITELSLQNFLDFENIRRGRPQQGYFQQEAGAQQDR
jgi:hypothetical protein